MQYEPPSKTQTHKKDIPLAVVLGQPVLQIPHDLYIPPDALEVILDIFEGPLDFLLYLIRRQNLVILDIPIAKITQQYIAYIHAMHDLHFELAAEYLVMVAVLAEIKSRMLLPCQTTEEEIEEDPRADLVRRLQEYERFKKAAEDIDLLPRMGRDTSLVSVFIPEHKSIQSLPQPTLHAILSALNDVLKHSELYTKHVIGRDTLSVHRRMSELLSQLSDMDFHQFESLFNTYDGKSGIIVTFLGILELAKNNLLDIVQEPSRKVSRSGTYQSPMPIYIKATLINSNNLQ